MAVDTTLRRANGHADTHIDDDDGERPTVRVQESANYRVVDEIERILIDIGADIYRRDRGLVRPILMEAMASDETVTITPGLEEFEKIALRDKVDRLIAFEKFAPGRGDAVGRWVAASPPMRAVETLLSRVAEWGFRALVGVIATPTMRRDGTILDRHGYDDSTRMFLLNTVKLPPMPENPTRQDALQALELLKELLTDFPFCSEASRAVALSMLLTPVVRACMAATPLHGVTAPGAGTGKSLMADLASMIYLGDACPILGEGASEEELEKRLSAMVLSGVQLMSIDNVTRELGGAMLCKLIERPIVSLRPLGTSKRIATPNRFTTFATGNNLRVHGDMTRRFVICQMDAGVERPENRKLGEKPTKRVLADRGKYVAACLIIVRAYFVAGRPNVGLLPLGSFEDWSESVRSALVWLGCADPLENVSAIIEDDPERQAKLAFLTAFYEEVGPGEAHVATAGQILKYADEKAIEDIGDNGRITFSKTESARPFLIEALEGVPAIYRQKSPESLGKWLRSFKGLPVGKYVLKGKELRANQTGFFVDFAPQAGGENG